MDMMDYEEALSANGGATVPTPDEGAADDDYHPFDLSEVLWKRFPYYGREIAEEVLERFGEHMDYWSGSAYGNLIFRTYYAYHGMNEQEGLSPIAAISEAGEQGELLSMDLNHFRGVTKHQIAMVTKDKPEWEPQARTTDSAAAKQVPVARNALEYAMSVGMVNDLAKQLETSKPCAAAFLVLGWDSNGGLNKQGWLTHRVLTPWEMAHEQVRNYDSECTWWIYRVFENRWDWVAHFTQEVTDEKTGQKRQVDPEMARKIWALDQSDKAYGYSPMDGIEAEMMTGGDEAGDRIATLHLYVKPSAACPEGRYAIIAGEDLVLLDGPCPYGDDIPITRMCSAEFVGTSIPYSDSWMLLAPTTALSAIISTIVTRTDMFGIPNVAMAKGGEWVSGQAGGANIIESNPGQDDVKVIDLLQIPRELGQTSDLLMKHIDSLSGINGVTRGQPEANVSSGSYAALLQSMAVQYNSNDERAYATNLERVGTLVLRILQKMATKEVLIAVCGEDEAWAEQAFTKEGVDRILRVSVKAANPISKTSAGRMELGTLMLQQGLFKRPEDFIKMVETGNFHSAWRGPTNILNYIKSENEALGRGEQPTVMLWDNDLLHLQEHCGELDPQHDGPELTASKMQHIQAHFDQWGTKSREASDLLAAIGQPPLPEAYAIGQQVKVMQSMQMGIPPAQQGAPPQGPQQQEQPGREPPPKGAPGPKPAPQGHEPSSVAPKQPSPSKTPNGERVA